MLQPSNNNYFPPQNNFVPAIRDSNQTNARSDSKYPFLARVISENRHPSNGCISVAPIPEEDLLPVDQSDVVAIESRLDEQWFLGQSDQLHGKLAVSCCQILDSEIPIELCLYLVNNSYYDLHVCYASFVAQDVGDLSITKGDIIVATNQVNEHWMQGQVCFDSKGNFWPKLVTASQIGTFPLNHCWRLDSDRVRDFCQSKINNQQKQSKPFVPIQSYLKNTHSSSLSSGSSSLHSSDYNQLKQQNSKPPPRPQQLPQQKAPPPVELVQRPSLLTNRQHDKLKGWLHTVRKKTSRLSTRITASLGLISLTRDEEFERHYESFRHIEKTIRTFIKNLTAFVEHFENFLISLQNTSENLANFYRDKSHQRELEELRKKNKALACEHFHAFKRTVDRQVIAVASQLLQKFSGPYLLINKRSAKLLDFDKKTKEMESCRDLGKRATLRDQYVIAKDLYDRLNQQLIEELPIFNQFAIDIFKECILVLLEGRKNLILSYTKLTASLLDTPLMMTYTASDVASSILMTYDATKDSLPRHNTIINGIRDHGSSSGRNSEQEPGGIYNHPSRSQSALSQLSSEFDQIAVASREISSTPLSQLSDSAQHNSNEAKFDELDGDLQVPNGKEENEDKEIEPYSNGRVESGGSCRSLKKDSPKGRKKKKFQIYVASWPFVATGPNQLTIACKQHLKLIKSCDECGNPDWSLVQDKKGQLGYVPSSYIKKKE